MPTYRYHQLKPAVAQALRISLSPVIEARLGHLKKIGCPADLPKPGSGGRVKYSWQHAIEMTLGLAFEAVGQTPRNAVALVGLAMRQTPHSAGAQTDELGDAYMCLAPFPDKPIAFFCWGPERRQEFLEKLEAGEYDIVMPTLAIGVSIINVSAIARRLAEALARVAEE